jgi:hypothetical protein
MYLSVPLPGNDTVLREVTVVPMDGVSKPQLYCVKVFKNDTVGAFIEAMAIALSIKVERAQQRLQAACVAGGNRVTLLDDMTADLPHKTRYMSPSSSQSALIPYCASAACGPSTSSCSVRYQATQ